MTNQSGISTNSYHVADEIYKENPKTTQSISEET